MEGSNYNSEFPYREAVGNLMFLQITSRPDIAFDLSVASRALKKPTEAHCRLIKRILRYLKGTRNIGLLYGTSHSFQVYSDADFAGDVESRKSTSGVLCSFGGAAVVWKSQK